jgi:hypothetical protein
MTMAISGGAEQKAGQSALEFIVSKLAGLGVQERPVQVCSLQSVP